MADAPAGWHPDANGVIRWWDGSKWTEHTRSGEPGEPGEPDGSGRTPASPQWAPEDQAAPIPPSISFGTPAQPATPPPPVQAYPPAGQQLPAYAPPPAARRNNTVWIVIGAIAVAGVIVVGGIIALIAIAIHSASDQIATAEKSVYAEQSRAASEAPDVPARSAGAGLGPYTLPSRAPGSYPTESWGGIGLPKAADAAKAPKDADVAKFCQIVTAKIPSGDDTYFPRLEWEKVRLGTPPDMPAAARKGWEGLIASEVKATDDEIKAESDYELQTAHCW